MGVCLPRAWREEAKNKYDMPMSLRNGVGKSVILGDYAVYWAKLYVGKLILS